MPQRAAFPPSGNTAPKMIRSAFAGQRRCYFIFISIFLRFLHRREHRLIVRTVQQAVG